MANRFTLTIDGLEKLQKKFDALPKEIQEETVEEIRAWAAEVVKEQQTLISQQNIVDLGALRQNTNKQDIKDGVEIFSRVSYAPFIEFGTGKRVQVPSELQDYAAQFKGAGTGTFKDMVKRIAAWLRRKGGNEKEAYIVSVTILNNGTKARPYFFPPYLRKRKQLIDRIKKVLGSL